MTVRTCKPVIPAEFRREDFDRCRSGPGKKTTVMGGSRNGGIAIFTGSSTRRPGEPIFSFWAFLRGTIVSPAQKESAICDS